MLSIDNSIKRENDWIDARKEILICRNMINLCKDLRIWEMPQNGFKKEFSHKWIVSCIESGILYDNFYFVRWWLSFIREETWNRMQFFSNGNQFPIEGLWFLRTFVTNDWNLLILFFEELKDDDDWNSWI
jgi:hypothetical protein